MQALTWILWRSLQAPPPDFIARQSQSLPEQAPLNLNLPRIRYVLIALGIIALILILLSTSTAEGLHGLVTVLGIFLLSAGLLILLGGTINGAYWAYHSAKVMVTELESGRYELMSLSPLGMLGALWLISKRYDQTSRLITFFDYIRIGLLIVVVFTGVLFFYALFQGPPIVFLSQPILGNLLLIGAIVLLLYLDYIQAVIIGHLSGIFFAAQSPSSSIAQLSGISVAVGAQFMSYFMAGIAIFLVSIVAEAIFAYSRDALVVAIIVTLLVFVFLAREFTIRILWQAILKQYAVSNIEHQRFQDNK